MVKKLKEGDLVSKHNFVLLKDLEPYITPLGVKRRRCLFLCHCGNTFICTLNDAKDKRKSCGCMKGADPINYNSGEIINGVKFIKTLGTKNHAQYALFECPVCNKEWSSLVANVKHGNSISCCMGTFKSKSEWVKISNTATFYKVRLYNEQESFIKIGITTRTVKIRLKNLPYKYEILKELKSDSSYIYDLEKRFLSFHKKNRYIPLIYFAGCTECFII